MLISQEFGRALLAADDALEARKVDAGIELPFAFLVCCMPIAFIAKGAVLKLLELQDCRPC